MSRNFARGVSLRRCVAPYLALQARAFGFWRTLTLGEVAMQSLRLSHCVDLCYALGCCYLYKLGNTLLSIAWRLLAMRFIVLLC